MAASTQPNTTLYVKNLNDGVAKQELRAQLYALFTTYGAVLDVVALKGPRMKGQAFLVFAELAAATAAMRALEGMVFYEKPMTIQYAKSKSHATSRRDDPNWVPPAALKAQGIEKRPREGDADEGRTAKKEKADDNDDEEMEIEDDD